MPFKKGVSGNPSGKKKQTEEQKAFLAEMRAAGPDMASALLAIIRNPKHKDHFNAIKLGISYAEGLPTAPKEMLPPPGNGNVVIQYYVADSTAPKAPEQPQEDMDDLEEVDGE